MLSFIWHVDDDGCDEDDNDDDITAADSFVCVSVLFCRDPVCMYNNIHVPIVVCMRVCRCMCVYAINNHEP